MKLLLTSGGLENQAMVNALRELLGKDFKDAKLVFIPTAANIEAGDKWWLISDLAKCKELGFGEVDIVDIAAVPMNVWGPRLQNADVIMVGGGNTSYLIKQMKESGLAELLPELLKTRVYVGISAGSMIVAPNLYEKEMQRLYEEPIVADDEEDGLGLVEFLVVPHMNSPFFPSVTMLIDEVAENITTPLYVIDDQTAVRVVEGAVDVVSEGAWKRLN